MESNSNSSSDDYKINTHLASTEANQYITTTIESLYQCFQRDYHDCPIFYVGSLQNACDEPFSSTLTEEYRPVLVYIQHDKSMINNIFCYKIFRSTTIINYLLDNYIVWPWDVTLESNRNILQSDTLIRTQEKSTRENVLDELAVFKEECDENERTLSFDFFSKTGLCWDVILEILKYFTLNDAINLFSLNILPLLHRYKKRVEIFQPSDTFIKMILRKLELEQIVSLRFNTNFYPAQPILNSLSVFTNITSLSLLNLHEISSISKCEIYFPKLIRLSFWYDNEVSLRVLSPMINHLYRSVKRLEVHCTGLVCAHSNAELYNVMFWRNSSIEYFLLDMNKFSLFPTNDCLQHHESCSLMTTVDFMENMRNIRHVQLTTTKYNINPLLNLNEWIRLATNCNVLNKITLGIVGNMIPDKESTQKILKIQKELQQKIKFQVRNL
ncbi:unnamed protein product [Rotaria sordida]|uniref:UAS domain-containing protein n=1 Tax=Rotaria sordida TaxID=392033 RepID=A0A814FJT0_9BILA|nr:unnamed protein product [Rotaria sordida]